MRRAAAAAAADDEPARCGQAARQFVRGSLAAWLRGLGVRPHGALFAGGDGDGCAVDAEVEPLDPQQLALRYPELVLRTRRKRHGMWFTDDSLCRPTVARTLTGLPDGDGPGGLRICDPAMGCGAFLLAAHAELVSRGMHPRDAVVPLHGVDIDATAAALAAWSLWQAVGDPALDVRTIEANVRAGDGLLLAPEPPFDAVIGNPPWETLQHDHRELRSELAADGTPLRGSTELLRRRFGAQGRGKLYTYRLFLEQALHLLRDGGRFGLLLPMGLWCDRDAEPLRRRLRDECAWEWLYAFENRNRLFPIDSRYRFGVVIGCKGGRTGSVRIAFGRTDPADWQHAEPPHLELSHRELRAMSPRTGTLVEVADARDLQVLRKMHRHGAPFVARAGGAMRFAQGDHNMTSDLPRFSTAPAPGRLPLYQGAMIGLLDSNAGAYADGSGHSVRWRRPRDAMALEPQFWVDGDPASIAVPRIGLRALSNATNERTAIACLMPPLPCGNSLVLLTPDDIECPLLHAAFGAGVCASLTFDWALRLRMGGTNLNSFVLEELLWPETDAATRVAIARAVLRLCAVLPESAGQWRAAAAEGWLPDDWDQRTHAARPDSRRELIAAIEVLVARAFGLVRADLEWMLRDCDLPCERLRARAATAGLPAKGFWRVDRSLPPDQRLPAQVLRAFR